MDENDRDDRGRFRPGVSGNPGGRVKGSSLERLIQQVLDEPHSPAMTKREALARALVAGAIEGNPVALRELLARLWPKELALAVDVVRRDPVRVVPTASLEEMMESLRIVAEVSGCNPDGTPAEADESDEAAA